MSNPIPPIEENPVLEKLRNLYERMEHDAKMEKAFVEDRDAFLKANGFDPKEVRGLLEAVNRGRVAGFKDVLNAQEKKLSE